MTLPAPTLYRDVSIADLDALGAGVSRISNNLSTIVNIISQISLVANPRLAGAKCELHISATGFVCTSYFCGTGDVVAGDPPIPLYPGDYIELRWTAGPPNGQGLATFYYTQTATGS